MPWTHCPPLLFLLLLLRICSSQLFGGTNLGAVPRASAAVPGSRGLRAGGRRPQRPALPQASWLGSQPCSIRAAAHQPAPWHRARDASQPGEEAAWLAASSRCLSCQPGGRLGRAETPCL